MSKASGGGQPQTFNAVLKGDSIRFAHMLGAGHRYAWQLSLASDDP